MKNLSFNMCLFFLFLGGLALLFFGCSSTGGTLEQVNVEPPETGLPLLLHLNLGPGG